MSDRMEQISKGAKDATAYGWFNRMGDKLKKLMPQGESGPETAYEGSPDGDLAGKIAGVSRMVQNPESTSTDWDDMQGDFMETGNLNDISDADLALLYGTVTGKEPGDRFQMIEDLIKYRDRMYNK